MKIVFWIIGIVIVVLIAMWLWNTTQGNEPTDTVNNTNMEQNEQTNEDSTSTGGGVQITDTQEGVGETAQEGDTVAVRYVGKLENGAVFDSSEAHGEAPFVFTIGAGQVIEGWERGVAGMKVGGTRTLVIPPELGYGEGGFGPIPGNATLTFDVELVEIVESGS